MWICGKTGTKLMGGAKALPQACAVGLASCARYAGCVSCPGTRANGAELADDVLLEEVLVSICVRWSYLSTPCACDHCKFLRGLNGSQSDASQVSSVPVGVVVPLYVDAQAA